MFIYGASRQREFDSRGARREIDVKQKKHELNIVVLIHSDNISTKGVVLESMSPEMIEFVVATLSAMKKELEKVTSKVI